VSLDVSRLIAHLPPEKQAAIAREYRQKAKHDTTAFLLCFFLGIVGAHWLYLGRVQAALPRLILAALALVGGIAGIALQMPAALVAAGIAVIVLLLLGWEILDLFHIDADVEAYNRTLLERVLGAPLASIEPPAGAPAMAAVGTITAEDIAGAHALAQGVGTGRAEVYQQTPAHSANGASSTAPAMPAPPMPAPPMPAWPAPDATAGVPGRPPTPAPPSSALSGDATDSYPPTTPAQPIADVEGIGAARVNVSLPDQSAPTQPVVPVPERLPPTQPLPPPKASTQPPPASAPAPAGRDLTDSHQQVPQTHPVADVEGAGARPLHVELPAAAASTAAVAAAATAAAAASRDTTDDHADTPLTHPVGDVEAASGVGPVYITLPQESTAPAALAAGAGLTDLTDRYPEAPTAHPVADVEGATGQPVYVRVPEAAAAASAGDALVMLVPSDEAPAGGQAVETAPVPPAEYVPPTVSPVEEPTAPAAPIWPFSPGETPPAAPVWPVSPSGEADDDTQTLAELGALGAAGTAGIAMERAYESAGAPTQPAEPTPAAGAATAPGQQPPAATPTSPAGTAAPPAQPMKRVRVVRRIVLEDGSVVRELIAERIVPADADSQAVAAELEAQLGHLSPEEIAQYAHLPGETAVVVRSRVESGPLSGKLAPSPADGSPNQNPPNQNPTSQGS
jgi:hypothetical protein